MSHTPCGFCGCLHFNSEPCGTGPQLGPKPEPLTPEQRKAALLVVYRRRLIETRAGLTELHQLTPEVVGKPEEFMYRARLKYALDILDEVEKGVCP